MKIIFIILFAIFNDNVEGLKIRAVRKRVIKYLPYNLNKQNFQSIRSLPINQRAPVYKNRVIYTYANPGGVPFNNFNSIGGRGTYDAYFKNLNRVPYQSVYQNWPNSDISIGHGNAGYNGPYGQSTYQSWQNSASGNPIDISVEQSGIFPGHRGHVKESTYQSWQDSASQSPFDIPVEQNVNSVQQSMQNSASEGLVDFPGHQTVLNTGFEGYQSKDQNWQNSGDEGEININVDQSAPNSANGGQIDYSVQHSVPSFGQFNDDVQQFEQNSDNEDQNLGLDQGEINGESKPQYNNVINEINVNPEGNVELNTFGTYHELNQPSKTPVQENIKDIKYNNENINIPIGTEDDIISPYNEETSPIYQINPNWINQNPVKETQFNNEGGISSGSDVPEDEIVSPDNESIIAVDQSSQDDQMPLVDIDVNNNENKNPKIVKENYQISPDYIDNTVLPTDDVSNGEESSAPVSIVPDNDLISTDDGLSPVGQSDDATKAPLRKFLNGYNNADISDPVSLNENNLNSLIKKLYSKYSYQQLRPLPKYPSIRKPNLSLSPGYTTTWSQATTTHQLPALAPFNVPYEMQPGNIKWRKPIANNISPPQVSNIYSSTCQNPNANLFSERYPYMSKTMDIQKFLESHGIKWFPFNYKNPANMKPNGGYIDADLYQKVNPNYPQGMNKHNIPQLNSNIPVRSNAVLSDFNMGSENFEPNPMLRERNEDVYMKPDDMQGKLEDNYLLESEPPMNSKMRETTEFTGYEMTPKQFVNQVTQAFIPKLLKLYHSKCDNGYDKKLIIQIMKLMDSIKLEHCDV